MKHYVVPVILCGALIATIASLCTDGGYGRLHSMRDSLALQHSKNEALQDKVRELRSKVRGIGSDDRQLEKEVRNELGLARPDEFIFIFEKKREE